MFAGDTVFVERILGNGPARDNGLKAPQKRLFKRTTHSNRHHLIAPNILDQDFACDGPDHNWSADISYIWTAEGWHYQAVVLDLYSRRIVTYRSR